ncbi:MAG: hypothetical protein K1W16_15525 [Lachnospiraceae bacterium]
MLFWSELKKTIIGIPYLLFVIVVVIALNSQGVLNFSNDKVIEPNPTANQNYGIKNEEIPELIMPAAIEALYAEFLENRYQTYPIGFVKYVKLNDDEQRKVAEIIAAITNIEIEKIYASQDSCSDRNDNAIVVGDNANIQPDGNGGFVISLESGIAEEVQKDLELSVRKDMSYSQFKELMQSVDDILGGGSNYAAESLIGYGHVPITYEEAVRRYELVKNRDRFTGGYARLFSDYAVAMTFSILPVFLAVIIAMKDKRAKMSELIYIRKISSAKIITMRFLAVLAAAMLPVIVLSYISNISIWNLYPEMKLDYLAPLKYDLGWIMPSAMITAAVGICLTELTDTPIAVAVCALWWFIDVNLSMKSVSASCTLFRLAPRHNSGTKSYFRTQDYIDHFPKILANRLLFTGLSIVLVVGTIFIYEAKRKGKFLWKK